jgi:hypothetical protein
MGKEISLNEDDIYDIESKIKASVPLKPIFSIKNKNYHGDWITHNELKKNNQSNLDNILNQKEEEEQDIMSKNTDSGFNFEKTETGKTSTQTAIKSEQKKVIQSKWNDDEEEDDEEIQKILEEKTKNNKNLIQSLTIPDEDNIFQNFSNSSLPGMQVALGNFKMVFNYLKSQLGITTNLDSLKNIIKNVYMSSYSQLTFIPCVPVSEFNLRQNRNGSIIPQNGVSIKSLQEMLEVAYGQVSENNMPDAQNTFRNIIKYSIFFIAFDKEEETKVKEIISICCEYIYLTRLCIYGDEIKSDKVRYAEVCCISTFCKLESSVHKFLIFKKAKVACKNIKNFISALVYIKKMLAFEKEVNYYLF